MKRALMPALMLATVAGIALPAAPAGAQMAPTAPAGAQVAPAAPAGAQLAPAAPAGAQLAQVQMVCGKRTDMVRQLGEKYGETRRSMGLADGRRVVELYASEETGSWTILMTSPQGIACMMAAGQSFQIEPVKAAGSPV